MKEEISARDEIFCRLKGRRRSGTKPDPWASERQYDDLASQFGQALTAAKGEYHLAASVYDALIRMGEILEELQVKKVIVNNQSPLSEADLPGRWPEISWHIVGETDEDLRSFAASADLGLSVGEVALAETGSVLFSSGRGRSRLTALLPPVHLALAPISCLTTDIFTWAAQRQGLYPSSMTLVSGPSKTADIEQTMATGVHGPGRFIVILYPESEGLQPE